MALGRRARVVFLSLVALVALSQAVTIPVNKCCPEGQALVNGTNECKPHIGPTSFEAIQGLDLGKDIHSPHRIIPINITINDFAKPKCRSNFETHLFRNKDVTRYGEYCVDLCGQQEGTDYFWCNTKTSWDYCSLDHKHTIYNQSCDQNCAAVGTDYFWCHLALTKEQKETCASGVDLWDYCSPVTALHSWLTVNGSLVTSRYESGFSHGDFCVDHVASDEGEVVALMCDPCTGDSRGKKHCLNLCCPHGHYETYDGCFPHNDTINWDPEFWSDEDTKHAMERNKDYVLTAPAKGGEGFVCPPSKWKSGARERMAAEVDLGYNFTLELNGNLKAKYPPKNPNEEDSISGCRVPNTDDPTQICIFEPNEFCLYFGEDPVDYLVDDPDYSVEGSTNDTSNGTTNDDLPTSEGATVDEADDNGSGHTYYDEYPEQPASNNVFHYMYCSKDEYEEPDTSQKITRALYPWAVGISNVFLFLTIIAIILEPELRKGLFGRITVGFVANLLIGYVFVAYAHNSSPVVETRSCVAVGYLTQYSFLAFFFWINAMALNIFLKFSLANKFKQNSRNENKKFWWYFLYTQGLPLVICGITALVDHVGHKNACTKIDGYFGYEDTKTTNLPNMGVFSCFLGASYLSRQGSYFASPGFIYFQLFLMIIQILNLTFFSITVHTLNKHWTETKDMNKNSDVDSSRENLYVVIKLFVIMGVTWVFEFITSWIEHDHGESEWYSNSGGFVMRIILDIPNLFQGFLIFVVLVCKERVLQNLKAKVTGTSAGRDTMASSTNKTLKTNAYSESGTNQEGIPLKAYPHN